MHQSMHSGSIARAASAVPMSAVSQPNWSRMPCATALRRRVVAADEHRRLAAGNCGLTIARVADGIERLDEVRVREVRSAAAPSAIRSRVVKNLRTPLAGGASAIGLVASITILPARLAEPGGRTASAPPCP